MQVEIDYNNVWNSMEANSSQYFGSVSFSLISFWYFLGFHKEIGPHCVDRGELVHLNQQHGGTA